MWQSSCFELLSQCIGKEFGLYVRHAFSACTSVPSHIPKMDTHRLVRGHLSGVAEVEGPGRSLCLGGGAVRYTQQSAPSMCCTRLSYLLMTLP